MDRWLVFCIIGAFESIPVRHVYIHAYTYTYQSLRVSLSFLFSLDLSLSLPVCVSLYIDSLLLSQAVGRKLEILKS